MSVQSILIPVFGQLDQDNADLTTEQTLGSVEHTHTAAREVGSTTALQMALGSLIVWVIIHKYTPPLPSSSITLGHALSNGM